MGSGITKFALDSASVAAEALCPQEIAQPCELSSTTSLKQLIRRFKSDEKLVLDLQAGEAEALTELYRRHCGLVFNVARRILHGDRDAEDVVQQVFLDVFRSIHLFCPEKGSFKTWLIMFAYQRTLNHRRALSTAGFFLCDPLDDMIADSPITPTRSALKPEDARILIRQMLESLPERERRTIELVYFDGMTAVEISRHTGESVRVVRHNLYRGLEKLRSLMSGEDSSRPRTMK